MPNRKTEADTEGDPALADSRETGGVGEDPDGENASTTSPSENPDYVGRIAGDDDGGASEESGAEARAAADD